MYLRRLHVLSQENVTKKRLISPSLVSLLTASARIVYSWPIAMSKAKKTRQQKIIADLRRKIHTTQPPASSSAIKNAMSSKRQENYAYSFATLPVKEKAAPISIVSTDMITRDLTKTMLITSVILVSQCILFFLLKYKIVSLPMFGY